MLGPGGEGGSWRIRGALEFSLVHRHSGVPCTLDITTACRCGGEAVLYRDIQGLGGLV